MLAMFALRIPTQERGHRRLGRRRERFVKMSIQLTHLSDGIAHEPGVLKIVDRLLAMPIAKGILARDHEVEGGEHLPRDLWKIDRVAEHGTHEADQTAGRSHDFRRI